MVEGPLPQLGHRFLSSWAGTSTWASSPIGGAVTPSGVVCNPLSVCAAGGGLEVLVWRDVPQRVHWI